MTTFTKLSAIALFSAFLTACDNATISATNNEMATVKADEKSIIQTEKAEEKALLDKGKQDYHAFREWQKIQEKAIDDAINEEVLKLGDKLKDEKLLREVQNKALLAQVELIKENVANLTITDPQVQLLKEKSIEALILGSQLMVEGEKVIKEPTEESYKIFNDLQMQLDKVTQEGRAVEVELIKKYEPMPEILSPSKEEANPKS